MRSDFIPTQPEDIREPLDFILVTGDAYVDHPSFGTALIGRYLQSLGYTCGIIAQPEYHSKDDFMRLGRPRLGFMVAAGNMDSMVSNYTSSKKKAKSRLFFTEKRSRAPAGSGYHCVLQSRSGGVSAYANYYCRGRG